MTPSTRTLRVVAAALGAIAVALGAFGAHALRETLSPVAMSTWQTAVNYLFWHVLAALGALHLGTVTANRSALLLLGGCVVFSASLFALALDAPRGLGAITPVGGLLLIGGWVMLAVAAYRER